MKRKLPYPVTITAALAAITSIAVLDTTQQQVQKTAASQPLDSNPKDGISNYSTPDNYTEMPYQFESCPEGSQPQIFGIKLIHAIKEREQGISTLAKILSDYPEAQNIFFKDKNGGSFTCLEILDRGLHSDHFGIIQPWSRELQKKLLQEIDALNTAKPEQSVSNKIGTWTTQLAEIPDKKATTPSRT